MKQRVSLQTCRYKKEYTFDDIDEMEQFLNTQNYHNIHNMK